MTKERIKSIILVLLIISNLVLAEKILVNKKLWLFGYNFFNIGNMQKKNDYSIAGQLSVPEKIFINTGYQSGRYEYLRTSENFSEIYAATSEVLKKAFALPSKFVSIIPSENWYSALTSKSIYLYYPSSYSAQIFSELLGVMQTELSFKDFSDIVISENGNVYICDENAESFYKIDLSDATIAPIIERIATERENEESVINYSFDLNFDKDMGEQKTILSHMIPIYSDELYASKIISKNPIFRDNTVNNKIVSNILTAFSINPNTVRRYTEADGSLVFVENTGILKISTSGILTYTATGNGIRIANQNESTVSGVAQFIDKVNVSFGADIDMCITSPLNNRGVSEFNFDYLLGGLPIKYDNLNAISIKTSNNYLTEYNQVLRLYQQTGELSITPPYIEALDAVITKYQDAMPEIVITKMKPAYLDDLTIEEMIPNWYIAIDNIIAE